MDDPGTYDQQSAGPTSSMKKSPRRLAKVTKSSFMQYHTINLYRILKSRLYYVPVICGANRNSVSGVSSTLAV
jgi:hypothetical protein